MSRREVVANAVKERAAAVQRGLDVPPRKRTPKQLAALETNTASLVKYSLELAGLPADEGEPTAPPVTPPVTPPSGDAVARAKSWDHVQAKDEIAANWPAGSTATPAERLAALGPGQFGRAVALGMFGSPDDTPLTAEQYALGDAHGGYWGRQAHGNSGRFVQTIYNASRKVAEVVTPSPMSSDEARALGKANGLNDDENGPA